MAGVREGKHLSLRDVASRMGISAPFLSDVEHGRRQFSKENREKWERIMA